MPTSTFTPGDEKQDEKLNPGQQNADQRFDLAGAEKRGTMDMSDFERNYGKNADANQENANIDMAAEKLRNKESGSAPSASWRNNTSGTKTTVKIPWYKKKKSWFGISGGGIGIAAILGLGSLAPAFLLPNLMQNATATNDVRTGILEQRFLQKLTKIMGANSGDTTCKTVTRCNAGKMPKSMLAALEKKGIKPINADGSSYTDTNRGTYVNSNPDGYTIDDGKGGTRSLKSSEFINEYKKNPAFRKSVKSAKNMMYFGYNGRYMMANFFKPYGYDRDGGLASDSELNENNVGEKIDEKLKPKADSDSAEGAKNKFRDRLSALLKKIGLKIGKAGGDPALGIGLAVCTTAGLPQFASGTWRAIQAAQLGVLLMDVVLSPAGAQQAGDIDGVALAAIGKKLTEQVDGKSALDSPTLQSAIGVNKNAVSVSNYAPGYALLSNPTIQAANTVNSSMKPGCDLINTPQAAVASAAIYAAISAATLGTGLPVIAALKAATSVAVGLGAIQMIMDAAESSGFIKFIADSAYDLIGPLLPNLASSAKGEDLGDALGSAMLSFFPQAGLAGGAAVLSTDQVKGVSDDLSRLNDERREEDIATLSPFDVSSQYTFLGSIMSNLSLHSVQDNPLQSSLSIAGSLLSSPLGMLTNKVSAADNNTTNCGYAASFGIDETIAINAAGYPCVGIPSQYIGMSIDEVYSLVDDEVDPETGVPKDDSDIMVMMSDCSEGDLESVTGCTIEETEGVDVKKRAAQSLYLFDMQVEDILTGEDNETAYSSDDTSNLLAFYNQTDSSLSTDEVIAQYGNGLTPNQTTLASSVLTLTHALTNSLKTSGEIITDKLKGFSQTPLGVLSEFNRTSLPRSPYWIVVGR